MTKMNVEVEGKEIAIKNSEGVLVIIPKNKARWVKNKLAEGCYDCIDRLVESLPSMEDYAADGSVYDSSDLTEDEDNPKSKRKIKKDTITKSKFDSEYYRLYASAVGLKKYVKDPNSEDYKPQAGWVGTNATDPTIKKFFGGTKDVTPVYKNGSVEWVEDFVQMPYDASGYQVKAQEGTGRLYPDISAEKPFVETDGDKHWNIAKFAYAPFFGKGDTSGYSFNTGAPSEAGNYPEVSGELPLQRGETDEDNKMFLLEDIYKYNLNNKDLTDRQAWRESKKFIRKEIQPMVDSDYHKFTSMGIPLGRVDEASGKDADWFRVIESWSAESESKISEKEAYDGLVNYNQVFRKMDKKEAKAAADKALGQYTKNKQEENEL